MLKFFLGFALAVLVVLTAGFCYVRFGVVDLRADLSVAGSKVRSLCLPSMPLLIGAPRKHQTRYNPRMPTSSPA